MKKILFLFLSACGLSMAVQAQEFSSGKGVICSSSGCSQVSQLQRQNMVEAPLFRHNEDVRRYNASPNPCAYRGVRREGYPVLNRDRVIFPRNVQASGTDSSSAYTSVKLRTEVVRQRSEQIAFYDATGCQTTRNMTTTIYKDVYSDGRCRVWQHVGYSN